MAGVRFNVNSGEVTLAAATAKTVLQIKAATNQRVLIRKVRLEGKQPAGGTDTVIKVRMTRSTASFGTGTAATLAKGNPVDSETLQTTAAANFTVEPTSTDSQLWWELQPQSSIIEFYPEREPIIVPGGQSVNFEATSPAGTPVVTFQIDGEE